MANEFPVDVYVATERVGDRERYVHRERERRREREREKERTRTLHFPSQDSHINISPTSILLRWRLMSIHRLISYGILVSFCLAAL